MKSTVRRDGDRICKDAATRLARDIRALEMRTERLRTHGIRTPRVRYEPSRRELVFRLCEGTPGRAALRDLVRHGGGGWSRMPAEALAPLLAPLVRLHAVPASELALEPLDPWRRIDPRLGEDASTDARHLHGLRAMLAERLAAIDATPATTVHGDFHAGQLVLPPDGGEPWLLDLDDLARGPVESDLGNFVAHVVTSTDLYRGDLLDGVDAVGARVRTVYEARAARPCDGTLIRAHAAIALLRRALKLAERGTAEPDFARIVEAAAALGGDIPAAH